MAIFDREIEEESIGYHPSLTKEEIINELKEILFEDFPQWYVFEPKENFGADLIIIRSVDKIIKHILNPKSPNPVQRDKEQKMQIVVAISIWKDKSHMPANYDENTKAWVYAHVATNSLKKIIRALTEIEKENE